jgi:hypothetical protein
MGIVKLATSLVRPLDGSQGGPLAEEVTGQRTIDIVPNQHHRLREIPLEHGSQLVRQTGPLIDGIPASLGQELQLARGRRIGTPHAQLIPVPQQVVDQQSGVGRVVFGPAIGKRLAIAGQPRWRQREQHQEVVLEQRIGDASPRLLETNGDRPAAESLAQTAGPFIDGLRRLK